MNRNWRADAELDGRPAQPVTEDALRRAAGYLTAMASTGRSAAEANIWVLLDVAAWLEGTLGNPGSDFPVRMPVGEELDELRPSAVAYLEKVTELPGLEDAPATRLALLFDELRARRTPRLAQMHGVVVALRAAYAAGRRSAVAEIMEDPVRASEWGELDGIRDTLIRDSWINDDHAGGCCRSCTEWAARIIRRKFEIVSRAWRFALAEARKT